MRNPQVFAIAGAIALSAVTVTPNAEAAFAFDLPSPASLIGETLGGTPAPFQLAIDADGDGVTLDYERSGQWELDGRGHSKLSFESEAQGTLIIEQLQPATWSFNRNASGKIQATTESQPELSALSTGGDTLYLFTLVWESMFGLGVENGRSSMPDFDINASFNTGAPSPVPLPAPLWLLISALAGGWITLTHRQKTEEHA